MNTLISSLSSIDLLLFQAINGLCGQNLMIDYVADRIESLQLKGLVFIATFGALWFRHSKTQVRDRETLILLLIAIVLSLVVGRVLANLLPFRVRPMFTSGIGYHAPLFETNAYFENWSAFPSDTAAIVFAMTTGFWLLSRWWGLLWAAFSIAATMARVYFGLHYPGDILAGALIGVDVMLAINSQFMHAHVAAPMIAVERRAPGVFYGLLFPLILEISTLFSYTRSMIHILYVILGIRH
ncbi:MAG TPA: phosphatase PAP2 family protein [Terriglobales bacterium]|nr:phosphatase PAP2 family protein [Terriglobales bacterium]